jgi:hypothetical protein
VREGRKQNHLTYATTYRQEAQFQGLTRFHLNVLFDTEMETDDVP